MSDIEELFDFENKADRQAKDLGIWRLPLRSVLTSLYLSADHLYTGGRFTARTDPKPFNGDALLSRISYLVGFLSSCSPDIGAHIDDAMSAINM